MKCDIVVIVLLLSLLLLDVIVILTIVVIIGIAPVPIYLSHLKKYLHKYHKQRKSQTLLAHFPNSPFCRCIFYKREKSRDCLPGFHKYHSCLLTIIRQTVEQH